MQVYEVVTRLNVEYLDEEEMGQWEDELHQNNDLRMAAKVTAAGRFRPAVVTVAAVTFAVEICTLCAEFANDIQIISVHGMP